MVIRDTDPGLWLTVSRNKLSVIFSSRGRTSPPIPASTSSKVAPITPNWQLWRRIRAAWRHRSVAQPTEFPRPALRGVLERTTLRALPPGHGANSGAALAGQRVQIIRPDPQHTGTLEFGTELIASSDKSLVALLGASPGASP